jgi:hypothetical protein
VYLRSFFNALFSMHSGLVQEPRVAVLAEDIFDHVFAFAARQQQSEARCRLERIEALCRSGELGYLSGGRQPSEMVVCSRSSDCRTRACSLWSREFSAISARLCKTTVIYSPDRLV